MYIYILYIHFIHWLFIYLFVCLFVYLLICLFVSLIICLVICMFIFICFNIHSYVNSCLYMCIHMCIYICGLASARWVSSAWSWWMKCRRPWRPWCGATTQLLRDAFLQRSWEAQHSILGWCWLILYIHVYTYMSRYI